MIITVDLGGTKMLTALLDNDFTIHLRVKTETPRTTDGNDILALIMDSMSRIIRQHSCQMSDLEGIAVSVPSPVDYRSGIVIMTSNIGFKNYPLRDRLHELSGVPVLVENDVNAGIYGEYQLGSGRGKQHLIGMYPGTGIGGGLILGGELYRGAFGGAGEIGHMNVQPAGRLCGCGRYGCLETLASKTALAKELVQLADIGKSPTILAAVGTDYTLVKSSHILKAMQAGEPEVIDLVNRAAEFLGVGMANCVNIFNPERIILGGGLVEKLGKTFVRRAERSMRAHAMPLLLKDVDVRISELGDDTVILGSALLLRIMTETGR
ncbi:MAG: ROK family protein [Salinispira sp.]